MKPGPRPPHSHSEGGAHELLPEGRVLPLAALRPALYPLSSAISGQRCSGTHLFLKGTQVGALGLMSHLSTGRMVSSYSLVYMGVFPRSPGCSTLRVTARLSETKACFLVQISPPYWSSLFCPLSLAVRGGQLWGKCPAGYFCPPGTSGLMTPGPRESQTLCPRGQLCAKPCPPGNSHFLTLGSERDKEKGCPAVTTGPIQAKQILKTVDRQCFPSNLHTLVYVVAYVVHT